MLSEISLKFFLLYHKSVNIVQKQSKIFAVKVHLSLGDDGSKK